MRARSNVSTCMHPSQGPCVLGLHGTPVAVEAPRATVLHACLPQARVQVGPGTHPLRCPPPPTKPAQVQAGGGRAG